MTAGAGAGCGIPGYPSFEAFIDSDLQAIENPDNWRISGGGGGGRMGIGVGAYLAGRGGGSCTGCTAWSGPNIFPMSPVGANDLINANSELWKSFVDVAGSTVPSTTYEEECEPCSP
jgi:hypothetical protein